MAGAVVAARQLHPTAGVKGGEGWGERIRREVRGPLGSWQGPSWQTGNSALLQV